MFDQLPPLVIFFCLVITTRSHQKIKMAPVTNDVGLEMVSKAFKDMMLAIPTKHVAFIFDSEQDEATIMRFSTTFFNEGIMIALIKIPPLNEEDFLDRPIEDIKKQTLTFGDAVYIIISNSDTAGLLMQMIDEKNFARRNIIYFFYSGKKSFDDMFSSHVREAMRVCVILNPRYGIFQVFYNQARSYEKSFRLVNWWSVKEGIFHSPLLPPAYEVYRDFNDRIFNVPVLHKPPWNFVSYNNDSILVIGGRDDQLLGLLSSKLNFRYEYFDPPDRSQGSAIINGSMQGVLGLIWSREVEFFIGDLTVTYERSLAVDFSFLTLTDSEAFLTHAPGRLNEALALIRPFNWEVWPPVVATFFVAGPLLYLFFISSNQWKQSKPLYDCTWITVSIFLKQNISMSLKTYHRVRFLIITLYLVSTYVIGDMYSANLTSMLARPAREKPVSTLEQLNRAMTNQAYMLFVEKHSASHAVLENGTGLYRSIWTKMKSQPTYLLNSTEEGILLVKNFRRMAVIGGRETFFYNTRRFGIHHFHLSEKLLTRYSAIAVQIGCPFIHNFNNILMALFEAGILTKITEDEYQKLGEKSFVVEKEDVPNNAEQTKPKVKEDDKELKAMSMKMLQGSFFVLLAGEGLAGIILIIENITYCVTQRK